MQGNPTDSGNRHEGRFATPASWESVTCFLCPHRCSIAPSRSGLCGVRSNRNGRLYLDTYGKVSSLTVLSGEQLPLFHYKPKTSWLSLSGRGCTMRCPFCNTYKFSQVGGVRTYPLSPQEAVERARAEGCGGISFGVNEPAPMHEYVYDVFKAAKEAGLNTHVETGGMWDSEALREMLPQIDTLTLGLKGLKESFLSDTLGANRETIIGNIDMLLVLGAHVEISWLVIPGITDDADNAADLLHILSKHETRPPILLMGYQPDFTWTKPEATQLEHLKGFHRLFQDYQGAVYELHPESAALNTCCAKCGRPLIRRGMAGLIVTSFPSGKPKDRCPTCNTPVPYVPD